VTDTSSDSEIEVDLAGVEGEDRTDRVSALIKSALGAFGLQEQGRMCEKTHGRKLNFNLVFDCVKNGPLRADNASLDFVLGGGFSYHSTLVSERNDFLFYIRTYTKKCISLYELLPTTASRPGKV
jgi:hypothetical protein